MRGGDGTVFLSVLCRYCKRRQDEVTSGQKIAVSILTTAVIFACFVVAAFAGLFSKIEARFYEPAKIADIRKQLDSVAEYGDTYINTLLEQIDSGENAYLSDRSVSSYALTSPSDSDVQQRARRTAALFSEASGLNGIRLIDANGRSVHFSTYSSDLLKQTDNMRIYKNYDELRTPLGNDEFAFFKVSVPDSEEGQRYRIVFDGEDNRILLAFPFYDPYDVYRGTMIFYVNAQDFNRTLIERNLTTVANTSDLISDTTGAIGGFVFGMPSVGHDDIERETIARWRDNSAGPDKIASIPASGGSAKESYWILISSNRSRFMKAAGVYRDSIFLMPPAVQFLLLACVFITLFLTIFMLFNLRRDDMVVIRDRVKRFQLALINEYFENKENINWADVSKKIAGRKTEVSEAIKESLGKRARRHRKETNALIDKSWNEIIGALNVKTNADAASALQDSKEIRRMLEEILRSGTIQVQSAVPPATEAVPKEISLAQESTEKVITFETNTDAVNAATEAEESFFNNMIATESAEKDVSSVHASPANTPAENMSGHSAEPFEGGQMSAAEDADSDTAQKIDLFGEIPMAKENADGLSDADIEIVNAATEAEEVFFENMSAAEKDTASENTAPEIAAESEASAAPVENARDIHRDESAEIGADKKDQTEDVDFFMGDGAETKTDTPAESANSAVIAKADAKPAFEMEEVDIDSFMETAGDVPSPDADIFAEPLQLGEPKTDTVAHEEIKPIDFDVVSAPNFLFLDENRSGEKQGYNSGAAKADAPHEVPFVARENAADRTDAAGDSDAAADAVDILPFENEKSAVPFSFTSFASNEAKIQNLSPVSDDVIIEGKDGVFSIAPDIALDGVSQDESFKRLVDSVIN